MFASAWEKQSFQALEVLRVILSKVQVYGQLFPKSEKKCCVDTLLKVANIHKGWDRTQNH